MRISDWSSDVCSSDLILFVDFPPGRPRIVDYEAKWAPESDAYANTPRRFDLAADDAALAAELSRLALDAWHLFGLAGYARVDFRVDAAGRPTILEVNLNPRSEEHTSELQSLMRTSYAVFCLQKKNTNRNRL